MIAHVVIQGLIIGFLVWVLWRVFAKPKVTKTREMEIKDEMKTLKDELTELKGKK